MKKVLSVVFGVVFLSVGVFLQYILMETAPQVPCNDLFVDFFDILLYLIIEYVIIYSISMIINKYVLKLSNRENLLISSIFSCIYFICFAYFFIKHTNICAL